MNYLINIRSGLERRRGSVLPGCQRVYKYVMYNEISYSHGHWIKMKRNDLNNQLSIPCKKRKLFFEGVVGKTCDGRRP